MEAEDGQVITLQNGMWSPERKLQSSSGSLVADMTKKPAFS